MGAVVRATAGAVGKRPGLPGQFDVAVVRAMAKHPDARYPSAGDLGRAAQAAAVGRSPTEPERMVARGAAAPGAAPTEPGLAAEASTRTAARFPGRRRRRRRAPLVAAVALLVAVGAVGAVAAMRDDTDDGSAAGGATPRPTASPSPTPSPTPTREALPRIAKTISNVGERPAALALAAGDLWITSAREPRLTQGGCGGRTQALAAPAGRVRRRRDRRVPRRPVGRHGERPCGPAPRRPYRRGAPAHPRRD